MLFRASFVVAATLLLSDVNSQFALGIFDGWLAKPSQFPFHALIGCVASSGSVVWICNGVIINNRFVATTASCVSSCSHFKIRVGSIVHPAMNVTEESVPRVPSEYLLKPGTKPYLAPGYVEGGKEHNLALLEVNEQIIYSHSIGQAKLPKANKPPVEYVQTVATGFGEHHKYNPYWELQFLTLNVLAASECVNYFPDVSNSTICAQGTDYNRTRRGSLCEEYGAPLVLKRDNRTLIGIYQYSREGCDEGGPELFLNIGSYVHWIRRTARFQLLDSNIFRIDGYIQ